MARAGISALGKLAALGLMSAAFVFGMAGVVYMSLKGEEVSVPEITGREFSASEKELAQLGLKIKKRADRSSPEAPNTIIEQLPKPGETVKTGQLILVVVSKGPVEGEERAPNLKLTEEDDAEKIEEMISDKPKKAKPTANSNRKKADTARDVNAASNDNSSKSNTSTSDSNKNSNKKDPSPGDDPGEKPSRAAPPPAKNPNSGARPAATPGQRPNP